MTIIRFTVGVLMCFVAAVEVRGDDRFDPLLTKLPGDTNAIFLVDVEALMKTDMAQEKHWAEGLAVRSQARSIDVPASAKLFVRGSSVDVLSSFESSWQVIVATLSIDADIDMVAKVDGGNTDHLGDLPAVASKRGMFIVGFPDKVFAGFSPLNRQSAMRWAKGASESKFPPLSDFLLTSARAVDFNATPMVLAIDLAGVASAPEILPELAKMKCMEKTTANLADIAKVMASVKGLTLSVSISDTSAGELRMEFGEDAAPLAGHAGKIFREIIRNAGADIVEMNTWEEKVDGQVVTLSGPLFDSGLRRATMFLESPAMDMAKPEEMTASDNPKDVGAATQAHFKAVKDLLDDATRTQDAGNLNDAALWIGRYATKIEQLSILNVDPEVLDWSGFISARMREAGQRAKGVQYRSAKRMTEHNNFYNTEDTGGNPTHKVAVRNYNRGSNYYDNGNYRYSSGYDTEVYDVDTRVEEYRMKYQERTRENIGVQERASGREDLGTIFKELQDETARVRRAMTEKYQLEF